MPLSDQLTNGDLAGFSQGPCHDGISLVCHVTVWHEVIRRLPITTVYFLLIHELPHVDGVLGFKFEVINFLGSIRT